MSRGIFYSKEEISKANSINLIEFAKYHGYSLENGGRRAFHAKQSGGLYFFRDSNKYHHFSTDTSGGPIDFAMQFLGMGFKEAVTYLLEAGLPSFSTPTLEAKKEGILILPERAPNFRRVAWYLIYVRSIDPEIVSCLMHEKKLYQQDKTGNCVFVGYDENQKPKYCSLRGCSLERPFKQDREYSDKSYPFHIAGTSQTVYVCESPIDAMSRATITKLNGYDWKADHYISLGCLSDQALDYFLCHNDMVKIIFCLDNDYNATYSNSSPSPNWGQQAAIKFMKKYITRGYIACNEIPQSKDVNEDLLVLKYLINSQKNKFSEEEEFVL